MNCDGRSAYADMEKLAVWQELCKPLKTGAKYLSELAAPEIERQGVGMNRWMQVAVGYLQYQNRDNVRQQNKAVLKEGMYDEL